jgi:Flp pilus assembly protein TadB
MNDDNTTRIAALLEELRDGQKLQLERQLEALDLQRKQFEVLQSQAARTERIQDKAEQLQDRSAKLVQGSRKVALFLLPVIVVLVVYVSWLIFRVSR